MGRGNRNDSDKLEVGKNGRESVQIAGRIGIFRFQWEIVIAPETGCNDFPDFLRFSDT